MIRGTVIGEVWATRRTPRLRGRKLLLVAELDASKNGVKATGRVVVAVDDLDARLGDRIIVSFGSGARNAIAPGSRDVLVDAAVVQVIDGTTLWQPLPELR
jgi:microcompartment protein CcmK/EutM